MIAQSSPFLPFLSLFFSEPLFQSPHQGKHQQLLQRSSAKSRWWLLSTSAEVIAALTQWHRSKSAATLVCRLQLKIERLCFKIGQPHQLPTQVNENATNSAATGAVGQGVEHSTVAKPSKTPLSVVASKKSTGVQRGKCQKDATSEILKAPASHQCR